MKDLYLKELEQLGGWFEEQVQQQLPYLPQIFVDLIAKYGVDSALDLTYELTQPFISQEFKDEIQGIADGKKLVRFLCVLR